MAPGLSNAFDVLMNLQRSMDHARNGTWSSSMTSGHGTYPSINVFEEDDGVVVVAELAGVDKDDINVLVQKNRVRIHGQKTIDYGDDVSRHRVERRPGSFDRTFTLPFQIDREKVEANHRDGLLAVRLPRAEADRPRAIAVA